MRLRRHALKEYVRCFYKAAHDTVMHDGIEHAGYLSFLLLLAMFPFLVFVVAMLGFIRPDTEAAIYITDVFRQLPPAVIRALEPRVTEITSGPPQGLLTLAIVGAIWTASSAVEGLRTVLNRAYRVHTPPSYLFRRSLSVVQLLVFAFILIIGMLTLVTLPILLEGMNHWLGMALVTEETKWWWNRMIFPLTLGALLLALAWLYYFIPNIRQRGISIWPGAAVAVALWLLAAQAFTYYLSHFNQVNLIYGSLGGIIAALLFFYVCNIITIFGAELNYHISQLHGMKVEEKDETV